MRWQEWCKELRDHPDTTFRDYILNGIKNGFQIGFSRTVFHRSRAATTAAACGVPVELIKTPGRWKSKAY